jgi:class 3 adenylate cyclase
LGETYKDVTVLYADICGFTAFSDGKSPKEVIKMVSELFMEFDRECLKRQLHKLYTIGDCYVCLGFLDAKERKSPAKEAEDTLLFAIKMIEIIDIVRIKINFPGLGMRIGIHTGDIVGGIVGTEIVRFDIYGANVFCANSMESEGLPGKIKVSEATKKLLEHKKRFMFEYHNDVWVDSLRQNVPSYFAKIL